MKYYIATRLENHKNHNYLRNELSNLGHELTYDWTTHGPVWQAGVPRIQEVCRLESEAIYDAHFVVVLMPGGRGTHVEMGMALALGKTVFFYSENENHLQAHEDTCAFYHHPFVTDLSSLRYSVWPMERIAANIHEIIKKDNIWQTSLTSSIFLSSERLRQAASQPPQEPKSSKT